MRRTSIARDVRAGCFVCHGHHAGWTAPNAQAVAARHHDRTGHETWCEVHLSYRYGDSAADPRQTDLEDAIAAAGPDTGRRPEAAPREVLEAPATPPAGVSAPESRPSRHAAAQQRGARGIKPETCHA